MTKLTDIGLGTNSS
jgi:hypothetical protein